MILTQQKYTKDILKSSGITNFKNVVTPLPLNMKFNNIDGEKLQDATLYRSLVEKLNFLTNTRPNLSFSVQTLSQFMQDPRTTHWEALLHTLNYISSTCGQGIVLKGTDKIVLQAHTDSDWGACPITRKSVSGYLVLLGNSPVSWKSKKQPTVSKSSSEVEYRAMANVALEITWVVRMLKDLRVDKLELVTLHCDSQSTIYKAKYHVFHDRT